MVRTRVGYAGGTKIKPTYYDLGDHSETIQIDYDPAAISYEDLLEIFWKAHDATQERWSTQYASKILYHDEEQRRLAEESKRQQEAVTGRKIHTEIQPLGAFYWAEDYHQKYYLRGDDALLAEMLAHYPRLTDFVNSTAAARLNGAMGDHISVADMEELLPSLGLSQEAGEALLAQIRRSFR